MIWLLLLVVYLVGSVFLAHRVGKRFAQRKPAAPRAIYLIAWWNGCTTELEPGIHAAHAIIYCCSRQPRARA